MLKASKRYLIYVLPLVAASALLVMLNTTSPLIMGPAGILVIFGLLYVLFTSTLFLLVKLTGVMVNYLIPIKPISNRKLYYQVSIISFAPIFLLALNSIGQLEIKDFVLVLLLVGTASFYVSRRVKSNPL